MVSTFVILLADLHRHHFSGGSRSGSGDDSIMGVFVISVVLIIAVVFCVSLIGGPVVLLLTRKARNLFWAIPGVNLLLYFLMLSVRPYPGGFAAQFCWPGLVFTVIEVLILLVLSLIFATVAALVCRILRKRRPSCEPRQEPIILDQ